MQQQPPTLPLQQQPPQPQMQSLPQRSSQGPQAVATAALALAGGGQGPAIAGTSPVPLQVTIATPGSAYREVLVASTPTAAMGAAAALAVEATRELLAEVEAACRSSSGPDGGSFSRLSTGPCHRVAQWFDLSTPKGYVLGTPCGAMSASSSYSMRLHRDSHRNSWPNGFLSGDAAGAEGSGCSPPKPSEEGLASPEGGCRASVQPATLTASTRTLPEEREDPCPALKPPRVAAPASPRASASKALTALRAAAARVAGPAEPASGGGPEVGASAGQ